MKKLSRKKRIERVKRILRYTIILLIVLILFSIIKGIFYPEISYLCPDGFTKVTNLEECPPLVEEKPEVQENITECDVCDDNDNCTEDTCSEKTGYKCVHKPIVPCLGNGICELGEYGTSDCLDCDDKDYCTKDTFNYENQVCLNVVIPFCCGNKICEFNESYIKCKKDCKELLSLEIVHSSKEYKIKDFFSDLTGSDKIFLIVKFKLTNLELEEDVTIITGESGKGYYFDPFKIKIKDEEGNYYVAEYDSDLLPSFLDYTIVKKDNRVGGQLAYVIPKHLAHVNLVAQSQEEIDLASIKVY